MLLAIDVGNSHTVFCLFKGEKPLNQWRTATIPGKTGDENGFFILDLLKRTGYSAEDITGIVIGSVVPTLTESLFFMSRKFFGIKPIVVNQNIDYGMPVLTDNVSELGADRIADAVAAYKLYRGPVIICDFGTATTIDYVNEKGEFVGGTIAPGIKTSIDSLFDSTAKLNRTEYIRPNHVIGKNTRESLQSGFYYGFAGMADGIIEGIMKEAGVKVKNIVSTGGLSRLVARESKYINHNDRLLTVQGLRFIYENNKDGLSF